MARRKNSCCGTPLYNNPSCPPGSVPIYRVWVEGELLYEGSSEAQAQRTLQKTPIEGSMYEARCVGRAHNPGCPQGAVKMIRVWDSGQLVYEGSDEAAARRALRRIPFVSSKMKSKCVARPDRARGEFRARNPEHTRLKNRLMR